MLGAEFGGDGTIVGLVLGHAAQDGARVAVADALGPQGNAITYAGLTRAAPRDQLLLVFSSGAEAVVALLGCLAAGLVPVPVMPPHLVSRHLWEPS